MSPRMYTRVLIVLAVTVMAASVWFAGRAQRETVAESFRQSEHVTQLLTAMLNQETGLRGYVNTGRNEFLEPFKAGHMEFEAVMEDARVALPPERRTGRRMLDEIDAVASSWHRLAQESVRMRRLGRRIPISDAFSRKSLMDRFRSQHGRLLAEINADRAASLDRLSYLSAALIVGLSVVFTLGGWLTFGRRAAARTRRRREELEQRERQTSFAHTLQFTSTEEDAYALVKRHLEASLHGRPTVTVLGRDDAAGTEEGGRLRTCTPLLVQGDVIGSVLVAHDEPLGDLCRQYVTDTATQVAPVVANMRNLAIAELRAATDALTGLANRRSIQETLRRMVAQAARSGQPLSAVAIDLDHFKSINDRFGHDKGDDVLAAAARTLSSTVRTSDFVGRQGGEEFIVLLPDTGLDGALVVAENVRRELERVVIGGIEESITGSFGVAVLPEDALDADGLLRQADRALYVAKERGRNRVEAVVGVSAQIPA